MDHHGAPNHHTQASRASENLGWLSYYITSLNADAIKRYTPYSEWLGLDRLLVQFWEARSTGPKVICTVWGGLKQDVRGHTECLLPELTRRGVIDLVE